MGVADFGVTSSSSAYSYSTTRFLATAQVDSITTSGPSFDPTSVSFQLNVVLVLTHGSASASYWIQDVPFLDTSTHTFVMLDNVWNLSSSALGLSANSIQGNGTVYSLGSGGADYYADQPGSAYPGNGVTLTYPATFSAEVVASTIAGTTHVGFAYNDGYGWVTYDNVTFPWTNGWSSKGFLVSGQSSPPAGAYYDAEWVLGGPGGGSSTVDESSNLTLSLQEFNGHNFQAVPHAFCFGGDTAETISNVVESLASAGPSGAPGAHLIAGPSSPAVLYEPANVTILNATSIAAKGDLDIDGSPLNYTGGALNVTLVPGSYTLNLRSASASDFVNLSVAAGEYFATTGRLVQLAASPASALPGSVVNVSGASLPPVLVATFRWLPGGSAFCSASVGANGSVSCVFAVPATRSGWYGIVASNRSSTVATGVGSFLVTTDLSATVRVSASSLDARQSFGFTAVAKGGVRPLSGFDWTFGDGYAAKGTASNTTHAYAGAGRYQVRVNVNDQVGNAVTVRASVSVLADPLVPTPKAAPLLVDVGQPVSFYASASLGTGSYTFVWTGLPPGCAALAATASCLRVTTPGIYSISVGVTDSNDYAVQSAVLVFDVHDAPTIGVLAANRTSVDVGQLVGFSTSVTNPGSGYNTLAWGGDGIAQGGFDCVSATPTATSCTATTAGNYTVEATVTDGSGATAKASSAVVAVFADPSVSLAGPSPATTDVNLPEHAAAVVTGGSGGLLYLWSGLPSGCATAGATQDCSIATPGIYLVEVSVQDSNGVSASSGATTLSVNPWPTASVTWPTGSLLVGQDLSFAAIASDGTSPYSYRWTFGDGSSASGPSVHHSYGRPASFSVSLWVNDSVGGSVRERYVVTVGPASPWPNVPLATVGGLAAILIAAVLLAILLRPRRAPVEDPTRAHRRHPEKESAELSPEGWEPGGFNSAVRVGPSKPPARGPRP